MKPTILQAYEKSRRIIESATNESIRGARRYISLFSKMFIYDNKDRKSQENAEYLRKDLLDRFSLKLEKLWTNKEKNETRNESN